MALADDIEAVATGDRRAYRRVYDAMGSKLFGIALRICGDRSLAEDALQETLVDIWRTAGQYDRSRGPAEAWVAVIARHRAIDAVRRRGRAPAPLEGDPADHLGRLPDETDAPDRTELMALLACLDGVERPQRDAVLLAYLWGDSREALSERFDVPVNTVKTWLRRTLMALKACLDGVR